MTLEEYQKQAISTDTFGGKSDEIFTKAFMSKLLGLVGESGELAEKFKKILRDKDGQMSKDDKVEIIKELGDVLWYVSALAHYLEVSLEDVASGNLAKVLSRKQRGATHGSGDNR
ncbi:nucleoside triphosphate pyrophosphohydrolase family protein [Candidatus Saccharibacteria bacterium]|nr:nucleoside triphosphate pyrophosphohydrolase family protein [Candidatus Saccharibacteria bacterium]